MRHSRRLRRRRGGRSSSEQELFWCLIYHPGLRPPLLFQEGSLHALPFHSHHDDRTYNCDRRFTKIFNHPANRYWAFGMHTDK
jgi:hypothetical protein